MITFKRQYISSFQRFIRVYFFFFPRANNFAAFTIAKLIEDADVYFLLDIFIYFSSRTKNFAVRKVDRRYQLDSFKQKQKQKKNFT